MVRLKFSIELACQVLNTHCDFLFNIHPAITHSQQVVSESVTLGQMVPYQVFTQADENRGQMKVFGRRRE